MADFLKITPRAAEALKPFMDEALRLERRGSLSPDGRRLNHTVDLCGFTIAQWRELIAAWRESMVEAEGITGGDLPQPAAKCG